MSLLTYLDNTHHGVRLPLDGHDSVSLVGLLSVEWYGSKRCKLYTPRLHGEVNHAKLLLLTKARIRSLQLGLFHWRQATLSTAACHTRASRNDMFSQGTAYRRIISCLEA